MAPTISPPSQVAGVIADGGDPSSGNADTGGSLIKVGTGVNSTTGHSWVNAGALKVDGEYRVVLSDPRL